MTGERIAHLRATSPREFDALVAEHVHGWPLLKEDVDNDGVEGIAPWSGVAYDADGEEWCPSTDPAADYATLKLVREMWDADAQRAFLLATTNIRADRDVPNNVLGYWVGDYSEAALRVVLAGLAPTQRETRPNNQGA